MKRSLVVLLVALLCLQLPGIAQKTPKAKVGITAGASLSNLVGKIDGRETRYDSKGGFCTGILVDVPLGKTRIGFRLAFASITTSPGVSSSVCRYVKNKHRSSAHASLMIPCNPSFTAFRPLLLSTQTSCISCLSTIASTSRFDVTRCT